MMNVLIVVVNIVSFRAPPKGVHALIKGFSNLEVNIKLASANIDKKLIFCCYHPDMHHTLYKT